MSLRTLVLLAALASGPLHAQGWTQWGAGPTHEGSSDATGQALWATLADLVYDPFSPDEQASSGGSLLVHFQAPLVEAGDVVMMFKTGTFTPNNWNTQVWNVRLMRLGFDELVEVWAQESDWKPAPRFLAGWEPVFHPAMSTDVVYVPGLGGSLLRYQRSDGAPLGRVQPFGPALDPATFVAGPLTIDSSGNILYNAIRLDSPTTTGLVGSWLVRVAPDGTSAMVAFSTLVPGAPAASDPCETQFSNPDLPWPPSVDAVPLTLPCGAQRAGLNVAPAVAEDGTIYTVSRAHLNARYGYLVAVNPDLTPKWQGSLRDRFNDGCNVGLPPNGTPGGCRAGANAGVDPATNRPGAGLVFDFGTASPVVAPDGAVLIGTWTRYNYGTGHTLKFSSAGAYLGAYAAGWDLTPSIFRHDDTYSILLKENHYNGGSYCSVEQWCPSNRTLATPSDPEQYFITSLSAELALEWRYKNTNTESCTRNPDDSLTCVDDHPNGFEWCVNSIAVDDTGAVYANNEDGNLFRIAPDGQSATRRFLQLATGAAYTPLSIGQDGLIYTQNDGRLFVVGEQANGVFRDGFEQPE